MYEKRASPCYDNIIQDTQGRNKLRKLSIAKQKKKQAKIRGDCKQEEETILKVSRPRRNKEFVCAVSFLAHQNIEKKRLVVIGRSVAPADAAGKVRCDLRANSKLREDCERSFRGVCPMVLSLVANRWWR